MSDTEVKNTVPTAEDRANDLRELAKRAERYRLNMSHPMAKGFSFRTKYFKEAADIIS